MEMAHEKMGGHLGIKKVRAKLNRLFTWPRLARHMVHPVTPAGV